MDKLQTLEENFPLRSYTIPLKEVLAAPHDQGDQGTCVHHAATKCMEMNLKGAFGETKIPDLSVQNLIDQVGENADELTILSHLKKTGVPSLRDVPFIGGANPKPAYVNEELFKHRLSAFKIEVNPSIQWLQKKLTKRSVYIQLIIYDNFPLDGLKVYRYKPTAKFIALHAVALVGWVELAKDRTQCFVYLTSYGAQWGSGGFGLVEMSPELLGDKALQFVMGKGNRRLYRMVRDGGEDE